MLASSTSPYGALADWIDLFVDFLITKHGLAAALQSDNARFAALHAYFLDRLVPICADLLTAVAAAQWLIDEKYTSTPKLAIRGRSNGGLLVGAALTQRPDLFGAALLPSAFWTCSAITRRARTRDSGPAITA